MCHGCFLRVCFFSPVILCRVQTAFRVFLENFVQMEKLKVYGANASLVSEQDYINLSPDEQDYGSSMCTVYKVTTLRNTAAKGNCPWEQKWHLELHWMCDMGTEQWQLAGVCGTSLPRWCRLWDVLILAVEWLFQLHTVLTLGYFHRT